MSFLRLRCLGRSEGKLQETFVELTRPNDLEIKGSPCGTLTKT